MSSPAIAEQPPRADDTRESRHLGWALLVICGAQLMLVIDSTIANIALPFIQKDLHFSTANLTWVVTGYSLAFGGLLLLGGRLGDLYGRRSVFTVGVLVFAIGSLVGGLAQDQAMLLGARGVQGLGAALASPSAMSLIVTTFPAGPARNRAFSVYAAMSGAGAAVGLVLGGWLTGIHGGIEGWRLTFLINVPIGISAATLAPRLFAESQKHPGELDVPGAIAGTGSLLSLVYGLNRASSHGWGNSQTVTFLTLGAALMIVFLVIESRVSHPLLPLRLFLSVNRATSYVVFMVMPAAMFAMFFYLTQYLQRVKGYGPLHTGLAFLPFSITLVVAATITSKLISRVDPRFLAGTGTALSAVALFGYSRIPHDATMPVHDLQASYWGHIFPWIVLMSIGMGMAVVTLTLTAVHGLPREHAGIGSGVLNTMQQVGGALGLSVLATVATHVMTTDGTSLTAGAVSPHITSPAMVTLIQHQVFAHGATTAFLAGAFMAVAGSLITWLFLGVKHQELGTEHTPSSNGR